MKKNLNEKELNIVSGGDFGDGDKEASETPEGVKYLYNIGDHVEVYQTDLHGGLTKSGVIHARKPKKCTFGCETRYVGYYQIQYDGNGEWTWAKAIDIQSS